MQNDGEQDGFGGMGAERGGNRLVLVEGWVQNYRGTGWFWWDGCRMIGNRMVLEG